MTAHYMSEDNYSNNKRIAKNTLLLYFRMLIMMAVTLYTSRVVLATLGVEDFGIYNVVGGVVTMFAFLNGTISGVTQRYLTYELGTGNKKKLQSVFNTSMCIHWIIALIILLLSETIGLWFVLNKLVIPDERITAAIWVYQFSIISMVIFIISVPYNACIIAHEKMSAFAYISIIEVILKLLVAYCLFISIQDKLILYAFLILIVQLTIRLIYTIYCKRHFEESKYKLSLDKALTKKMIRFTGWSLFGGFASVGMTQGVNILLNLFFGPVVNAARAVAVQIESAISAFSTNFQIALNPQIIKYYASNNLPQMQKLIYASSRYSFFLLFVLSLPVYIEANFILNIWLTDVPDYSVTLVRFTLIIMLVECISKPIMTAANATGNIKRYQTIVGTLMLLIVPLSYLTLLVIEKPEIVFIIYLIIVLISLFVRLWIVKDLVGLSIAIFVKVVIIPAIYVVLASIVAPTLCYFVFTNEILKFIVIVSVSAMSSLLAIYFIGINDMEKNMVKSYVKNMVIINRIKNSIYIRANKLFRKIINTVRLLSLDKDSYIFLQMAVKWNGFNIVPYNFGDDLNVYLFEELTGKKILKYDEFFHISKSNYLGIGSIIEWCSTPHSIVWGSGAMYGDNKKIIRLCSVKALRGKYTKSYLEGCGIKCPDVFGDPALLLPLVYNPNNVKKKYRYGIVPHYIDLNSPRIQEFSKSQDDVLIINLQKYNDWHEVINLFLSCENIVSSSLHGLIIADAYRIPNVRINLSNNILGGDFKYKDYFSGIGRPYQDGIDCSKSININIINSSLMSYHPINFRYERLLETFPFPLASRYSKVLY